MSMSHNHRKESRSLVPFRKVDVNGNPPNSGDTCEENPIPRLTTSGLPSLKRPTSHQSLFDDLNRTLDTIDRPAYHSSPVLPAIIENEWDMGLKTPLQFSEDGNVHLNKSGHVIASSGGVINQSFPTRMNTNRPTQPVLKHALPHLSQLSLSSAGLSSVVAQSVIHPSLSRVQLSSAQRAAGTIYNGSMSVGDTSNRAVADDWMLGLATPRDCLSSSHVPTTPLSVTTVAGDVDAAVEGSSHLARQGKHGKLQFAHTPDDHALLLRAIALQELESPQDNLSSESIPTKPRTLGAENQDTSNTIPMCEKVSKQMHVTFAANPGCPSLPLEALNSTLVLHKTHLKSSSRLDLNRSTPDCPEDSRPVFAVKRHQSLPPLVSVKGSHLNVPKAIVGSREQSGDIHDGDVESGVALDASTPLLASNTRHNSYSSYLSASISGGGRDIGLELASTPYGQSIATDNVATLKSPQPKIQQSMVGSGIVAPDAQTLYIRSVKIRFFSLGILSGATLQLLLVCIVVMCVTSSTRQGPARTLTLLYFPLFRGAFLMCFYFALHGISLFIWKRNNIDYMSVLSVSYAHTHQYVIQGSATLSYIVLSNFSMFILTVVTGISLSGLSVQNGRHIWPALAVFIPVFLFILPIPDSWTSSVYGVTKNGYSQRKGLLHELMHITLSPWAENSFIRAYITDVLCSMPAVFQDIEFTICLYVASAIAMSSNSKSASSVSFINPLAGSDGRYSSVMDYSFAHAAESCEIGGNNKYFVVSCILRVLPFYFRFCQCIRCCVDKSVDRCSHLLNAFKYLLCMSVALISQMLNSHPDWRTMWLAIGAVTTVYSFAWDVIKDWGLGNISSKSFLLRDRLIFSKQTYYVAIIWNFFARLGWTLVISPGQPILAQQFVLLLGVVELIRRAVWGIFRVEWESIRKIGSCGIRKIGYGATAPVTPQVDSDRNPAHHD